MTKRQQAAAFAIFVAAATSTTGARAQGKKVTTKEACHAAYDATQKLRREGKLSAAHEQAVACARDVCSRVVRADCTTWVDELGRAQPTVVFEVRDASGAETAAVTVSLDAEPWLPKLEGTARAIDPGEHVLRFEIAGQPPRDEKVLIREGEKDRKITVSFAPVPKYGDPMVAPPDPGGRRVPLWAWISGGAGAGLVVAGVVFGAAAASASSRLNSQCTPSFAHCDPTLKDGGSKDDVTSRKNTSLVLAGTLGGAGIAALGAGVFGFVTAPNKPSERSQIMKLEPIVAPGIAGLLVKGTY